MWCNAENTGYVYAITLGDYTKVGKARDFRRRMMKIVRPEERASAKMLPVKTRDYSKVEEAGSLLARAGQAG